MTQSHDKTWIRIFTSVRFRLTFWYLLVFGSLLVLFSSFIYASILRELQARVDRSLADSLEMVASVFRGEVDENGGDIVNGATEALSELRVPNTHISIILDGKVVAADSPDWYDLSIPAGVEPSLRDAQPVTMTVKNLTADGTRLGLLSVEVGGKVCTFVAAHPLADIAGQLASIRKLFYLALPGALLIAGLGGFLMAKKSLGPVMAMSEQAERIGATNLHERLHVENTADELGRLAGVFNELLSRLDGSFKGMRQFMADASHELRTPLSIVRGEADIALSQDRDASEYRAALEIIQDEAARLSRIVEDMLELARADAGQRPLNMSRFYVNDVVEECCRSMHVLSAAKGVALAMTPFSDIAITGDEDLVRRMILNLLDNAIKYTLPGGSVSVGLRLRQGPHPSPGSHFVEPHASPEQPIPGTHLAPRRPSLGPHASLRAKASGPNTSERPGQQFLRVPESLRAKGSGSDVPDNPAAVDIVISDTGIGVPAELAGQVFDRFYRGTQGRTEHPRGTGLGLAIARWIAESHGGSITLSINGPAKGSGSTFTISLPAES